MVRLWYSQEFEHKELWRNAAEFASSRGHLMGLKIENRQGEGEATIRLFFDVQTPDELKVIFIEYVHRHLAKYGASVTRDRRYVCGKCGTPVKDLEAVRRRFAAGKDFIYCQTCDKKVQLIDFIEQRLKSDPVARKILAMEQTATRRLDAQALEQNRSRAGDRRRGEPDLLSGARFRRRDRVQRQQRPPQWKENPRGRQER
ncbi:MAG TPA: hypothetical protein VIY49_36745 [Bryobacteraceae bacterium]